MTKPAILVIAPHADDAELGMGGALARMILEDVMVPTVAILAEGDYTNRHGHIVYGTERVVETAAAMALLGITKFIHKNASPENQFDMIGQRLLIEAIDDLLGTNEFEEVYVCLPSPNQDHEATYKAVITAFRPGRWPNVRRIWAYEYPGHNIGVELSGLGRRYVRLARRELEIKLASIMAHVSQFGLHRPTSHCGPAGALHLATLRGSECGAGFAELFWLIREIY